MSDEGQPWAEIVKHPEWSDAAIAEIDKLIASHRAGATARAAKNAERFIDAGDYRIARPAPAVEVAEESVPPIELPESFARFAGDLERAQAAVKRVGLSNHLPGIVGFLTGIAPHERTPTAGERGEPIDPQAVADAARVALVERYGAEEAERIQGDARACVGALGLGRLLEEQRVNNHADLTAYLAQVWGWRSHDANGGR